MRTLIVILVSNVECSGMGRSGCGPNCGTMDIGSVPIPLNRVRIATSCRCFGASSIGRKNALLQS
jgi:hypothetical protein